MDILTSLSEAEGWKASITAFALIYGAVVTVLIIVLVIVGLFFEIMNSRRPERWIQKDRRNRRKWKELTHNSGVDRRYRVLLLRRYFRPVAGMDDHALDAELVERAAVTRNFDRSL
ncbi:hypothetical protein NBH20_19335 [Rhizobium sp. S153]|uniref:Uncharacterized protein n=1 Tax=Ciceribacter sichuanensis TaxID=2949647 RepID=A0ABT0VCF7_9HYPH|nr:hypothetical protein [Ciceribacter sp. S153]MCM2403328.1 hypothetical protein [Ciceribacter sp. S153]